MSASVAAGHALAGRSMLESKHLIVQAIVEGGQNICDEMGVEDEADEPSTYYFEVGSLLEAQQKLIGDH